MEKAIITKEWLKTKLVFFICLAVLAAVALYAIIMMKRLIELKGVEHLWLIMMLKDNSFVDVVKYFPTVAGIAIGVSQMLPEMKQKRLKLSLHLPYPIFKLVGLMLLTGLTELAIIFLIQAAIIAVYDLSVLPTELVMRIMFTMIPWYFAGFTAYLFITAICLEGVTRRRILLGMLAIAIVTIYFLSPALEAYNGMLVLCLLFILLFAILSYGSVIRFKEGYQD